MGRPKKPDGPKISVSAMLETDLLEQIDREARNRRLNRSQFLAAMIERGYAAFRRDGSLFDEEDRPEGGDLALPSEPAPSSKPEPKAEAKQSTKKKSPDPEPKNVGFRIIGMGHGNVLDPPNKKKAVPPIGEQIGKKKGPRNEG